MRQVSGMDDFFLHFERSGLPMHIGSFAIFDPSSSAEGPPDLAQIRESIGHGVRRTPVLRQRLGAAPLHIDRPYWTFARDFDLDDHVRSISLSGPATWQRLCSEVARLFQEPLDLARPLFEVTVIENLDGVADLPSGAFALVTKVHHAVLDGVSGVEIMRAFCDASAEVEATEPDGEMPPESEPTTGGLLLRAWLHQLDRGFVATRLATRSLQLLARSTGGSVSREPTRSVPKPVPRTRFNERPSQSRVFGGCHLDLSEVQEIRGAVAGATVNDVILTIVGGALRRYLDAHGELPADPVVAMAPISIRSEEPAAAPDEPGGTRVSMMAVSLGTEIEDPLERLEAVRQTARSSKKRSSEVGSSTLLDVANVIPSALGELAARAYRGLGLSSHHAAFFSCVVSNVPGPRNPLFLAGSRMIANYGLGPIFDGVGLIHPVLSYDGGITTAFTSCPEMLPDPAFYEECLRDAFDELAVAAGVRGAVAEANA
jgi:WS/DGAT/MGAT family acyltransferase